MKTPFTILEKIMDANEFWALNADLPPESAAQVMQKRLTAIGPEKIIQYQNLFEKYFGEAYRWDLWGAAYLIDGGCSDDGFAYFRYGLISRGRQIYEAALKNPDSLAAFAGDADDDDGYIPNADFGHAAAWAYEELTGDEMPWPECEHPPEPAGEGF